MPPNATGAATHSPSHHGHPGGGGESAAGGSRQYSTFYVDNLYFGIEVLQVQEVLRYQEMTRVPLAPDVIEGLINLRGQIVTAVDMRRRLKLTARPAGQTPMNMVVRSGDGAVSLLVDEIGDVIEVKRDCYEATPVNMPAEQRQMIDGVYKLDGRLLLVLATERVLEMDASECGTHSN
jgi:purine-binding chemotaxis protein CheW